jgi:hypothetical protein
VNRRRSIIPLLLLGSVLLLAGCEELPVGSPHIPASSLRGITLVDWSAGGYAAPEAELALQRIAATGASDLAILVTAYQQTSSSNRIYLDSMKTPSLEAVRHLLRYASDLGLKVTIKFHVDVADGSWRASIDPSDPDAWFASYREILLPLAALTDSSGGDRFLIGCELAGTLRHGGLWRETIRDVRSVFHRRIGYAASWDEASIVPFWGDLDFVGVDCYYPVTVRNDPGRLEILSGWAPVLDRLELLHRQTGREIVLTEIGYRSIDGAGRRPYAYATAGALDPTEQADLYWAALQATSDLPWLAGIYWWNWRADGMGGTGDGDYTPEGKPAETVLRQAWRQ